MPMQSPSDFGTKADGSPSEDYCTYCYQGGAFTEPDITMEEMAEKGGAIMAEMYEIPIENAKRFALEQLSCLKRWAGREVPSCGSCGMPMRSPGEFGTGADGSPSKDYCTHCYRDGAFVEPELTLDAAVERYAPMMAGHLDMPLERAREMVRQYLSTLPRWRV
ncbi:hypothetical protein CUJ86_02275 [Methanofollis fontis]|uniref:Putative zinc ribbon domain-containing protein n=2 Tax=Methanofollis fontis TaxID=2052832 RepID=A0A483CSK8_9EURY|nr:hypothetical protein CUJ86_02275 [Methanofollis fontis]